MMQQMLLGLGAVLGDPMGNVRFTMCAGGGAAGSSYSVTHNNTKACGGGGAGGYIDSYGGGPGNHNDLLLLTLTSYTVTIGAHATAYATNGSNTSITGTDVNGNLSVTAIGGGGGGHGGSTSSSDLDGKTGGSGGGGGCVAGPYNGAGGSGTSGQGEQGAQGTASASYPWYCSEPWGASFTQCVGYPGTNRGGGGAGPGSTGSWTMANGYSGGGLGAANYITGNYVWRCGGGRAAAGGTHDGWDGSGAGGGPHPQDPYGKDGILILRYSNAYTISNPGGGLTIATTTYVGDKISQITAGTGVIEFAQLNYELLFFLRLK